MPTVTGFTAARMLAIEEQAIVDGEIIGDNLILVRNDETTINAGNVRGPQGVAGPPGGLGEAPIDGSTYGRKDGAWEVAIGSVVEAPTDGKAYARQSGSWIIAPGSLLGSVFNDADSQTALSSAVSFDGGGTTLMVAVGSRGVTVEFGALIGHFLANKTLQALLYVDGVLHPRGQARIQNSTASGTCYLSRTVTFPAGELSVGNHTFEVKAKQNVAESDMLLFESQISIRSN